MADNDNDGQDQSAGGIAPRPPGTAPRGLRPASPILAKPDFERLNVTSHRELVVRQAAVVERLHTHPDLAIMLFVNPVLAFREFGIELSSEMADHVLHALQHPPALRARRDELEASLTKALGATPQPNEPQWLARTLFGSLELAPLDTGGREPLYVPALPLETLNRLAVLRPAFRNRRENTVRRLPGMAVRLKPWHPTARRIDLVTPAPELPHAGYAPEGVTLEELYFYKDANPLARDLLELGIIRRRAFPIQTGDSYRRVKAGEKPNAFRSWITSVRFPTLREEAERRGTKPPPGNDRGLR